MDTFYTPEKIAALMVRHVRCRNIEFIADFAAGDGGLLTAAASRFPGATFVATDVDRVVVSRLQRKYPQWATGCCDFLSVSSRDRCRATNSLLGRCSVILLNPPFSYRGGAHWCVEIAGERFRCSHAMAFVINAIPMLNKCGQMIAIMPLGSLKSNKDRSAWNALHRFCRVEVLSEHGRRTFDGCYPRTALVRLTCRAAKGANKGLVLGAAGLNLTRPRLGGIQATVVRGWVQMHTVDSRKGRWLPLIHSKDLTADFVRAGTRRTRSLREISGPAVLMPRVGQPSADNLCVLCDDGPVALSDCVLALRTEGIAEARRLHLILKEQWSAIEELYGGTCARYITLNRLRETLARLGVGETVVVKELGVTLAA